MYGALVLANRIMNVHVRLAWASDWSRACVVIATPEPPANARPGAKPTRISSVTGRGPSVREKKEREKGKRW